MITQENIPYTADEIKAMAKTCEKYNKAREKARELMNKGYDVLMPEIFPELNENEDEKIKREIVAYINELADLKNEKIPTKWLAWLEEQKDYIKLPNSAYTSNKDVIEFADTYSHDVWEKLMDNFKKIENYHIGCNDVSDIVLNAIINTYNWLEKQGAKKRIFNADDWYVSEVDGKIHNSKFIEKQGEKKPTDKVEPKFKVGDWYVYKDKTYHLLSDNNGLWTIEDTDGRKYSPCEPIDIDGDDFHLWSINDAKDGDVLIRETGEPFIYNGNHGSYIPEFLGAYCGISDGRFRPNGSTYYWGKPSYPATKEQRDLLFQKMKEAGYEWDAEKKMIKTIEQKPADKIEPKFKVGDWIIFNGLILHIDEVVNGYYRTTSIGDGIHNSYDWDIDNAARLWTIQDAKDGDVLVCTINKAEIGGDVEKLPNMTPTIFIYQNVVKDSDYIHSYCSLYNRSSLRLQNAMYYNTFVCYIHPATKEEHDLLFQKMKEAGCEWDSEKKELKRIEPKKVNANKVIEWLKNTIKEKVENYGIYKETHLILPYNSIEDLITDFKEDFGL